MLPLMLPWLYTLLAELCQQKQATMSPRRDRYVRSVDYVSCAGFDANAEQVRRGMAWVYERYAQPASPLHALQAEARSAQYGLWADPAAVPPWDWRPAETDE